MWPEARLPFSMPYANVLPTAIGNSAQSNDRQPDRTMIVSAFIWPVIGKEIEPASNGI